MQIPDGILLQGFAKFCWNFSTSTSFFNSSDLGQPSSQFADFLQMFLLGMTTCGETWAPRTDPLAQAAASHCQVHSLSHSDMCDKTHFLSHSISHLLSHPESDYLSHAFIL